MSDMSNGHRPFEWRFLEPVPQRTVVVANRVRPDPTMLGEFEYRASCMLGKWHRELAAMAPGSGRHYAALTKARAAGGLVAMGLLDEADAFEALYMACEANGLTRDPGGTAERTIRDGLSYGAQTPWVPDDLPDSPVWRTRYQSPRIGSNSLSISIPPLRGDTDTKSFLPYHTAREVAEEALPQVAWIARPWIAEGGLTEVDGKVKQAGKTTWLLALIQCVLTGERFMNQSTIRTPVVLLSEQSPRSLQQALQRAGLEACEDLHILFWHETRAYHWPQVVEDAAARCREVGARLLAVDTLSQFVGLHGDSENSSGDALQAMQPLQTVIARDGIAVVFNRHERKSGGDVGDSGRGSSAYAGAVDIIISLRRAGQEYRPTVRHLHALSRFDETPSRTMIELQGMRYVTLGDEESVAADRAEREVIAALDGPEHPLTADQLREPTTLRRNDLYEALRVLLATGRIRRIGRGVRGDPFMYFRPQEDEQDGEAFD